MTFAPDTKAIIINIIKLLNTLEISFKRVTNTLLYAGIRSHTANGSKNFALA